ncbi:MAG: HAMP domain-containing sensor histidine kinase [Eubacteriales bacterium]|nr:HAMP domain-containing sensor histidine kinase [Eubacteriales bacterium]
MKLKTKLVISFCIIVIMPIVMFLGIMMINGNRQLQYLEEYANQLQMYEQETEGQASADGQSHAVTPGGMVPEIRSFLKDMMIAAVLILFLTALLLIGWIYTGINVPLMKLKKATHNIAEGNLDFTLEVSGDDEISDLCRDFEEMRLKLRESSEEKLEYDKESKELISNISHDLKTPITAIKGYVEGIMDGVADTPEKMDRYIRTIYNKANDMDRLINELTFYSKIDTNRIPYTFDKINVSSYFEDCFEEVGLDLESKNIDFSYSNYVDEDVEVIADAEQMKRVINNIIGNSVKYMDKPKGRINIRVKDVGDFIQVEIEDNGKGIGPKELPYIFDRFYRTDASRNSSMGGSGIGLSIVRKIVEDHGGKIWASSKPGTGTVMYFVLRKVTVAQPA